MASIFDSQRRPRMPQSFGYWGGGMNSAQPGRQMMGQSAPPPPGDRQYDVPVSIPPMPAKWPKQTPSLGYWGSSPRGGGSPWGGFGGDGPRPPAPGGGVPPPPSNGGGNPPPAPGSGGGQQPPPGGGNPGPTQTDGGSPIFDVGFGWLDPETKKKLIEDYVKKSGRSAEWTNWAIGDNQIAGTGARTGPLRM